MRKERVASLPGQEKYGAICRYPKMRSSSAYRVVDVQLKAHEKTETHQHLEMESFYILSGMATVTVDGMQEAVSQGDLIHFHPLEEHSIQASESGLHFLSIYEKQARVFISPAPPTPNGPLHLGHASGPYLAADILNRHLRSENMETLLFSGTDDHQPFVKEYSFQKEIQKDFQSLGVSFDTFVHPSSDSIYQERILKLYKEAMEEGLFQYAETAFPYCEEEARFYLEPEVSHDCQNCGASLLSQSCEECTHFNSLEKHPLAKKTEAIVFQDFPVALPFGPGIGLGNGMRLNVWVEMALNYVDQIRQFQASVWVPLFGKDNRYYYQQLFPKILSAFGVDVVISPIMNDFLLLDGEKFSTSRRHAVWVSEAAKKMSVAEVRQLLCFYYPEKPNVSLASKSIELPKQKRKEPNKKAFAEALFPVQGKFSLKRAYEADPFAEAILGGTQ